MEKCDSKFLTIIEGEEMTTGDLKNGREASNGHIGVEMSLEQALEQLKFEKDKREVLETQITFLSDRLKVC